jgi:DNA-binding NarL/FixJ family response regulator
VFREFINLVGQHLHSPPGQLKRESTRSHGKTFKTRSINGVTMSIKVLLADDSAVVRRAIRGLLTGTEIELIAEAENFAQAIKLMNELKPQVLVVDLHMNDKLPELKPCDARVVAMSFANDEEAWTLAQRLGADALLDKTELFDELIPTIRTFAAAAN